MAVAALYLFIHSRRAKEPYQLLDWELHGLFEEEYKEAVADLIGLGLAEEVKGAVQLTPQGFGLASDVYGEAIKGVPETLAATAWAGRDEDLPAGRFVQIEETLAVYDTEQRVMLMVKS